MEKWNAFLNKGTKSAVVIKKVFVILMFLLAAYGIGYAVGTFLAHIGL
ncbi:MAG: hypothetical protein IKL18_00465 [Oscillospiraceae bacterium]|nr:hypothetical protein [Oscillospiraceae bacterium]MBR6656633.1 hypothetical protein [Oscillospiraceae bacterium]